MRSDAAAASRACLRTICPIGCACFSTARCSWCCGTISGSMISPTGRSWPPPRTAAASRRRSSSASAWRWRAALWRLGPGRLRPLATWPLLLCAGWLGITVLLSIEPSLSIRRAVLMAIAVMLSAGVLIVARSPRQFALTLAGSALVVLLASYLAVALVPDLAIHSSFDVNSDPSHPGLWRGIFPHKNEAGAAMVILIIVGLYVRATLSRFLGWAVVLLGRRVPRGGRLEDGAAGHAGDPRRHRPVPRVPGDADPDAAPARARPRLLRRLDRLRPGAARSRRSSAR